MQRIVGDALRGHLENLLLAVLERAGAAHGLELIRRLEAAGSGALMLKEGTLYPALYRLEQGGMVRAEWEGDARRARGPRRRIYRLTPKGKRRLVKSREEFERFTQVIGGILGASV